MTEQSKSVKPRATLLARLYRHWGRHQGGWAFGATAIFAAFIAFTIHNFHYAAVRWMFGIAMAVMVLVFVATVILTWNEKTPEEITFERNHPRSERKYARYSSDDVWVPLFALGYIFWAYNWPHLERVYPSLIGYGFVGLILVPLFVGSILWEIVNGR